MSFRSRAPQGSFDLSVTGGQRISGRNGRERCLPYRRRVFRYHSLGNRLLRDGARRHLCASSERSLSTRGDRPPSVELRLHAHVLRARRDCNASIHTHQPIASAYTLLGRALEVLDPRHRAILGPKAARVSYAPSGTSWLASQLGKTLRPDINAYLLRNHGVVCCGPTLDETVTQSRSTGGSLHHFFRNAINSRTSHGREPSLTEVLTLLAGLREMESPNE